MHSDLVAGKTPANAGREGELTVPFTTLPIHDPAHLIGRAAVLARIENMIKGGPVRLFGGTRTGKTSVMRALEKRNLGIAGAGYWWFWDAQALPRDGGLDGATRQYAPVGNHQASSFVETVDHLIQAHGSLVLLLDEGDALVEGGVFSPDDFRQLRAAIMARAGKFTMVFASSLREITIEMPGSELLNMARPLAMPALEVVNALDFYSQYLTSHGMTWKEGSQTEQSLYQQAGEFAGTHPWLLQLAGGAARSAHSREEYFRQINDSEPLIRRHVAQLLGTLAIGDAIRYASDPQHLDAATFEPLGMQAGATRPGIFDLFAQDWLRNLKPSKPRAPRLEQYAHALDETLISTASRHPYFEELLIRGMIEVIGGSVFSTS